MASSSSDGGSEAKDRYSTGGDSASEEEEERQSSAANGADSPPEEERRNWLELPREVTASILSRLIAVDILTSAQFVCKAWLEACKDPLVWRRVDMYNIGDPDLDIDLEKMCRHAVDRSCGQVVDINIEYFANDDLLNYVTERSTQIKRLRLTSGYYVSDEGLIETVSKLPLLEELELTLCSFSVEPLEAVGRHCPHLKSFKLNCKPYRLAHIDPDEEAEFNEEAIAIAKNMPELRHLQLIGNPMTNMGLKAILDGCPHLESLDLRRCLNISLNGDLWKRCTDQVKNLWLPNDSTKDYPFKVDLDLDDDPQNSPDYVSSDDEYPQYYGFDFPSPFDDDYPDDDDGYGYLDFSSGGDFFDYDDFTVPDNF